VPRDIPDDEVVIRAVTSWHVKKGRLTPQLFKHDEDQVSVSRRRWIEPWLAKFIAKARIENSNLPRPKLYTGLAFVSAKTVRSKLSDVRDSREEYLGHADIVHGIAKQNIGEALLPPQLAKLVNDRAKKIADAARYVPDPKPESFLWTVPD
jgi:hypothetical protein